MKFQDLIQSQIEQAFQASGLVKRCLDVERQNALLFQLLSNHEAPNSPNIRGQKRNLDIVSKHSDGSACADESNHDHGSLQIVETLTYFDKNYEMLKIEILKRLKKDLHLSSSQWHADGTAEDGDDDKHFQQIKDQVNAANERGSSMEVAPQQLIQDEELFKNIREEVLDVLDDQRMQMKRQYDAKVATIQNMNYELRKSFLKELHLLRESYYMRNTRQIDY